MTIRVHCFAVAAVALFIVGCQTASSPQASDTQPPAQSEPSSAPPAQPKEAAFDPRTLLTVEEAKGIFNQEVHFTEPEQLGQFASTLIQNKTENILATLQISTLDYEKSKFESDIAESAKMLEVKADPVAGMGDSAYRMGELLMVLEKRKWVQVTVTKRPGVDPVTATNAIMKAALGRVP